MCQINMITAEEAKAISYEFNTVDEAIRKAASEGLTSTKVELKDKETFDVVSDYLQKLGFNVERDPYTIVMNISWSI